MLSENPASSQPQLPHDVEGVSISSEQLVHPLAVSLSAFVAEHGGRDLSLDRVLRVDAQIEAVTMTVTTSVPQEPAYPILPTEPIAVFFLADSPPVVVPLRRLFPATPHSYGLPMDVPTSASLVLCVDDRPWVDARSDYSGPELVRRIFSWFERTGSGDIDDLLQVPDLAFLPAPFTLMMPESLADEIIDEDGPPVFVALKTPEAGSKLIQAIALDDMVESAGEGMEWIAHIGMGLDVVVENAGAMWRAPTSLGQLRSSIRDSEHDLLDRLKNRIKKLLVDADGDLSQLCEARLIIRMFLHNTVADRLETFCLIASQRVGEIGVALGLLLAPEQAVGGRYTRSLAPLGLDEVKLSDVSLDHANFITTFGKREASIFSGRGNNWRDSLDLSVVALGAGAIGSQVLTNMVREGAFKRLVIVDDDYLSPHNLARHSLRSSSVGKLKAGCLAKELKDTRADLEVLALSEKLDGGATSVELFDELRDAEVVFDMTASVGAGRQVSDVSERGRGASAFFNPMGDAVVTLVEDKRREQDLATLEALYYAELVDRPELHQHLGVPNVAVVGGGQCRETTNRIPASSAAILSGIASNRLSIALPTSRASLSIDSIDFTGPASHMIEILGGTKKSEMNGWTVRVSDKVVDRLRLLRDSAAPNETGGVLLGIVDHARQCIEVVTCPPRLPHS